MEIDKSGQYLRMHNKKPQRTEHSMIDELFATHAHLFYHYTDRILKDPRMAMALVKMDNNLAYSGTSGLSGATLGVYVTWWQKEDTARMMGKDGILKLMCQFAGSPLSGMNGCNLYGSDGKWEHIHLKYFRGTWGSFMSINRAFHEKYSDVQAYTLDEVINLLEQVDMDYTILQKSWYHQHVTGNKEELERSSICGCVGCKEIYRPTEILDYIEDTIGMTAVCPYCFTDAIIGDASGMKVTKKNLRKLNKIWF